MSNSNINKMKFLTFSLMLFVLLAQSCYKPPYLNGNGDVETTTRQMFSFNAINSQSFFNVYIEQDSVYQVIVQAESNLLPYIQTAVNGNTLIIDSDANIHANYPINVYVKTPTLNSVELSGSGNIQNDTIVTSNYAVDINGSGNISGSVIATSVNLEISGSGNINYFVNAQATQTKISGSGDLNLSGTSLNGNHLISGSGQINAYSFLENYVQATISGSGNMYISVSDQLTANISGSGSIFYVGNPALNIHITGSGSVIKQ